jgi:hypothetical protein
MPYFGLLKRWQDVATYVIIENELHGGSTVQAIIPQQVAAPEVSSEMFIKTW